MILSSRYSAVGKSLSVGTEVRTFASAIWVVELRCVLWEGKISSARNASHFRTFLRLSGTRMFCDLCCHLHCLGMKKFADVDGFVAMLVHE